MEGPLSLDSGGCGASRPNGEHSADVLLRPVQVRTWLHTCLHGRPGSSRLVGLWPIKLYKAGVEPMWSRCGADVELILYAARSLARKIEGATDAASSPADGAASGPPVGTAAAAPRARVRTRARTRMYLQVSLSNKQIRTDMITKRSSGPY